MTLIWVLSALSMIIFETNLSMAMFLGVSIISGSVIIGDSIKKSGK
jgi:hypothetical protein